MAVSAIAQAGTGPQWRVVSLLGASDVRFGWCLLSMGEAKIHTWGNVWSKDCMSVAEVRYREDALRSDDL